MTLEKITLSIVTGSGPAAVSVSLHSGISAPETLLDTLIGEAHPLSEGLFDYVPGDATNPTPNTTY